MINKHTSQRIKQHSSSYIYLVIKDKKKTNTSHCIKPVLYLVSTNQSISLFHKTNMTELTTILAVMICFQTIPTN